MNHEQRAAYIRAMLLATPNTYLCQRKDCQVITQGGLAGYREHCRRVHGTAREAPKK